MSCKVDYIFSIILLSFIVYVSFGFDFVRKKNFGYLTLKFLAMKNECINYIASSDEDPKKNNIYNIMGIGVAGMDYILQVEKFLLKNRA